jgi:hypothetical protein
MKKNNTARSTLQISLKGEFSSRVEGLDLLRAPGDAVLIVRGTPRWLILRCPCGCGDNIPINLDSRAGEAWRIYGPSGRGLTLFPSVWRETGCESHFVIWRDRISLIGSYDEHIDPERVSSAIFERILSHWQKGAPRSYVEFADSVSEVPWDVLHACRALVREGKMTEGTGKRRGWFKRTGPP